MKKEQIEHKAVYYSPRYNEIFVGYVALNHWSDLGGIFWIQRLTPYKGPKAPNYLRGLVKIGHLLKGAESDDR